MKNRITMDKAGRIVLPKAVRQHFHLMAGDYLGIEVRPEGIFLAAPSRSTGVVEENGLLVHEGDPRDDIETAVERARSARDADVLGTRW